MSPFEGSGSRSDAQNITRRYAGVAEAWTGVVVDPDARGVHGASV